MIWLLAALSSGFLWGLVQTLDKLSIGRLVKYVPAYLAIIAVVGAGVAAIQYVMGTPIAVGSYWIMISLMSGFLTLLYTFLFLTSLYILDAPEASTILLLVPMISTVIGVEFFGESISSVGAVGMAIILLGAYLATREEEERRSREKTAVLKSVGILVAASFMISIQRALQKYATEHIAESSLFFWERMAVFLAVVLTAMLLPDIRKKAAAVLADTPRRAYLIALSAEVSALAAIYTQITALRMGPLGTSSALISSSPVFALLIISAANSIRPDTIPDTGSSKQFLVRFAAIMLTIAGIWMLRL